MAQARRMRWTGDELPTPRAERQPARLWSHAVRRLLKNQGAVAGIIVVGLFALVALLAPFLAPHPPQYSFPGESLRPAWWQRGGDSRFVLGTDTIGRDVLSRVMYGARTSLAVGFIPLTLILLIGCTVGLIAGYFGGQVDNLLMRLTDIVYAFPDLLFYILLTTALRETWLGGLLDGFALLFVALALVSWVTVARLMRGQVLAVKAHDYVQAARSIGASHGRIMLRHILPNSLAPIIVAAAFIVPAAILSEAILGYLGVGIRPTADPYAAFPTSWGQMLLEGRQALESQPWILVTPTLCIALLMLAFTFIGDGLRDALDPLMTDRL